MSYFIKSGSRFDVTSEESLDIHQTLPIGTYGVGVDPRSGAFFYEMRDPFEFKGKIYGDTIARADRILNTFHDRKNTTGVLLSGEKGSGKTLLAKMLSIKGAEQDVVTIVINTPFTGDGFNMFMQQLRQPAIILFDEFEKVFDEEQQKAILTLLDGTFTSKKMFIMTVNDRFAVNQYMTNRPGRFFYSLKYHGLTEDFIREYCADTLKEVDRHTDNIVRLAHTFTAFNFDMLQAIIEELNRYGEEVKKAVAWLNISPDSTHSTYEVVTFKLKNREEPRGYKPPTEVSEGRAVNLLEGFWVSYNFLNEEEYHIDVKTYPDDEFKLENYAERKVVSLSFDDVKEYKKDGVIVVENDEAYVEILKKTHREYSLMDFM